MRSETRHGSGYAIGLLILLSLANGVVALDRLTVSYLSPFIVKDLHLSNTQVGLLQSALSLAVAISSFWLGQLADRTGKRKTILIAGALIFSIGSAAGGFASGFAFLFLARFLLGFAEGPMVPISQVVLADATAPERRGFFMGAMQMTGAFLFAGFIGPWISVQIAEAWGWRSAFFLSAAPGLLLALGLALYVDRDRSPERAANHSQLGLFATLAALWRVPNMRLALGIAGLFTGWLAVQNSFLALYLTNVKGLTPTAMSGVLSVGGIGAIAGGIALPWLSDRIGRRAVCAAGAFAGVLGPLALLWLPSDAVMLGVAVLLGWTVLGIAPLYCAVIPSESVPPALVTSAIGLAMGVAELVGGVIAPAIAGRAADAFGLAATLWLCAACAVGAGLLALGIKETAPDAG
jgi:predicted MFS family arabinose efflux permease